MCFKEIIFQVLYPSVNFSLQIYIFEKKKKKNKYIYLGLNLIFCCPPISPKVSMSYQPPILLFLMQYS